MIVRKIPKLAFSPTRFIIFSLLCSHYVIDLIKKLETRLMVVSNGSFLKIKFRHTQIRWPKIGILM